MSVLARVYLVHSLACCGIDLNAKKESADPLQSISSVRQLHLCDPVKLQEVGRNS